MILDSESNRSLSIGPCLFLLLSLALFHLRLCLLTYLALSLDSSLLKRGEWSAHPLDRPSSSRRVTSQSSLSFEIISRDELEQGHHLCIFDLSPRSVYCCRGQPDSLVFIRRNPSQGYCEFSRLARCLPFDLTSADCPSTPKLVLREPRHHVRPRPQRSSA
jgi:hypothetical protein